MDDQVGTPVQSAKSFYGYSLSHVVERSPEIVILALWDVAVSRVRERKTNNEDGLRALEIEMSHTASVVFVSRTLVIDRVPHAFPMVTNQTQFQRSFIPRTPVLVCVLQTLQMTVVSGVPALP